MVVKNPDLKKYDEVSKAVEQNDGYCPCLINKNKDTRCMCKEFLDKVNSGYIGECRCGRYVSLESK